LIRVNPLYLRKSACYNGTRMTADATDDRGFFQGAIADNYCKSIFKKISFVKVKIEMLRSIQRKETDPYFNLAAEEYLLRTATEDTFMTWCNELSVVVGKHQNTFREINHSFIEANKVPVIRRITGGGTVYHDPGNLNFSFIYTGRKENLVDFREFTLPIILFLKSLGLDAVFEGKNNITASGLKVSGNSAHIFKNKVLHHGTLLFNTELEMLARATDGREDLYEDRAVRSIRAKVSNINDLLKKDISFVEFTGLFHAFILNYFKVYYADDLHPEEIDAIGKLADDKYKAYKWNYGYSPGFEYNSAWKTAENQFSIKLIVNEGIINTVEITGTERYRGLLQSIREEITGGFYERKSITEKLKKLTFVDKNHIEIVNQIVDHLF
jgi:lipoate-protein ligase A